ncbi:da2a336a-a0a7-40f1-8805-14bacf8cf873-CDS [Sclerotinia trifoliorum]|uniref:Da2a336a-a0a7-40f1-8805-14bacf8cf873-CDS n=1 Tax=Sclerotinia trifoliorum TaxID=28548 RepID=A0A8H2VQ19_9HELO|nr:da2a336a-a0a7-40f1-8805-14bacf8cf873-CDS [Sclerotinia trifoliorum]
MDSPAEDVVDSRSNVVGRKRALHTSSDQGTQIVSIDSSSDESEGQPRKRAKQSPTESARVEINLTSSPMQKDSAAGAVKPGANIAQPVAWNQGVQSGLRTSFKSKKPALPQNPPLKETEQDPNNNGQGLVSPQGIEANPNTVGKFKGKSNQRPILTRKQLSKLSEERQLVLMTAYTQDVSALIDLYGWPVPEASQQSCLKYIEDGLTFYPTPIKKDQPVGYYSYGGGDVQLRELLNAEGKPIMIEHITYSDVLCALVVNNEFFKSGLSDKRAKAAFKAYMRHFYNHVPQRELFTTSLVEKAPFFMDVLKNSRPPSKGNVKPTPEEPSKKSGDSSNQKVTQAPAAQVPVIIDSEPNTAPAKTFSRVTPPDLTCAVDHYDANAAPAINNKDVVEDEAPMEQNNAVAANPTTESNGKLTARITPTPVTDINDPTRDRRILAEAATVQMNHGSSESVVGSDMEPPLVDLAVEIDYGQGSSASCERVPSPKSTPEDRAAILKYFPTTDGIILRRCLVCGSSGHDRALCPDSACSSCGSTGDHLTPACPRTSVCGKCRGVGHLTSHCPEKLRAAKEDVKCIICQSSSHLENQCHLIWRSFLPGTEEIKKVRSISVYCYFCGRTGHFGPECGLHHGEPASGGISWSSSNLEKYLDDATSHDSTSLGGNDHSIPSRGKKGFTIKGKANDPIELDDSDDDEGFIHPKVNMGSKNGQIQFSQVGAMQSFNQEPPFQFQGNARGNPNSRASSGNRGGRGGRGGGGSNGDKKKSKQKNGNSPPRGGGSDRKKAYRGRGGSGAARGAPRGRR